MKIAILTFHRVMNYGAILQAYALERKFQELGAEAEVIDYRSEVLEKEAKILKSGDKIGLRSIPKIVFRVFKHRGFFKFMNKNMKFSKTVSNQEELKSLNNEYDAFVVGSDQVWNLGCIQDDTAFSLDFVENRTKRYSYAASIGGDEKRAEITANKFGKEIKQFSGISLREKNVIEYMRSIFGEKIRCDVDPVLLLTKEQWSLNIPPRRLKKPYIFVYLVGQPINIKKFASNYAIKNDLVVVDSKKSVEFIKHCDPQDFLSWIYYADVVITNSFHGTAFSVLFEKELYVEYKIKNGYNYRSQQLLETLGILDREIKSTQLPEKTEIINYAKVKNELYILKKNSEEYLRTIVNGSNK